MKHFTESCIQTSKEVILNVCVDDGLMLPNGLFSTVSQEKYSSARCELFFHDLPVVSCSRREQITEARTRVIRAEICPRHLNIRSAATWGCDHRSAGQHRRRRVALIVGVGTRTKYRNKTTHLLIGMKILSVVLSHPKQGRCVGKDLENSCNFGEALQSI
ncbi:MAG: hypothetical protein ACXVIU_12645 [Halobacteriota archaeon]